jgi:SAM-dependent methyltransferase
MIRKIGHRFSEMIPLGRVRFNLRRTASRAREAAVPADELNGDLRLPPRERLLYLWRNACRNFHVSGGVRSQRFVAHGLSPENIKERVPSRFLTDLFIKWKLPHLFPPRPIEVLEIGGGSGSIMQRLFNLGYSGIYVGVDIDDRFEREHGTGFAASFVQSDIHLYAPKRPVDLIFSFSTLEHIERDDILIARLSKHVRPGGAQVHVVPAAAGLFINLWHGYRQYRPSDLAQRFGDGAKIFRLGGAGSLLVHFVAITVPENLLGLRLREIFPSAYGWLVLGGFIIDRALPVFPSALLVYKQH